MSKSETTTAAERVTAGTLRQSGWTNSWIDGVRRWHHKRLIAHFKSLDDAKAIYRECQEGRPNEKY